MKVSGGFFKDKAANCLNSIVGDHVDAAILKATSTDVEPPGARYVRYLVEVLHHGVKGSMWNEGRLISDHIASYLTNRTHSHNWVVVEKALIVLHRLLVEDRNDDFTGHLLRLNSFNRMKVKRVEKSTEGSRQKLLILQYVAYLKSLTELYLLKPSWTQENAPRTTEGALTIISRLIRCMQLFVEIPFRDDTVNNVITFEVFSGLNEDSKQLFTKIGFYLGSLSKKFESMSDSEQKSFRSSVTLAYPAWNELKNYMNQVSISLGPTVFEEGFVVPPTLPEALPLLLDATLARKGNCSLAAAEEDKRTTLEEVIKKEECENILGDAKTDPTPLGGDAVAKPVFVLDELFGEAPPQPPVSFEPAAFNVPPAPPVAGGWDTGVPVVAPQMFNDGMGGFTSAWNSGIPQPQATDGFAAGVLQELPLEGQMLAGLPCDIIPSASPTTQLLQEQPFPTLQKKNYESRDPFRSLYKSVKENSAF